MNVSRLIGAVALALMATCCWALAQVAGIPIGGGGGPGSQILPSAGTVGDLVVVGPLTQGVQDASALATNATVPTGLNFTNNIAYSGAYSLAQQWLSVDGLGLSGTVTTPAGDALIAPFHIYVGSDTVDTTTSGNGNLNVLAVNHATSAGSKGGRCIICGLENIVGTPTTLSAAGYISVSGITRVSANLTGTTGAYGNYKGAAFGGGFSTYTTSGATFVSLINAQENDVTLASATSAAEKHALTIVLGSNDAVRAVYDDNAIEFAAQDNGSAVGWKTGIMFGAYAHQWAFATDSTLIGAQVRTSGAASSSVALYGVDWSAVTFQSGGCSFKSTGFCVDPSGNGEFTGTTGPTLASGMLALSGVITTPTFGANGEGAVFLTSANGLTLQGQGSANDFSFNNKSGTQVCELPTGGTVLNCQGFIGQANFSGNAQAFGAKNTSSGAAAQAEIYFGNSNSATQSTIILNGGSFSGGKGANALAFNNGGDFLSAASGGAMTIYNQPTSGSITYAVCAASGANGSGGGAIILDTSATICGLSSRRWKEHEQPINDTDALAMVMRLQPKSFDFREGFRDGREHNQIGLIAEDVQFADERLIERDPQGLPRGVSYAQGIPTIAIGAIQNHERRIEALEAKVP